MCPSALADGAAGPPRCPGRTCGTPAADGLGGNDRSAFQQEFLAIVITQRKAVMPSYPVDEDLSGRAVLAGGWGPRAPPEQSPSPTPSPPTPPPPRTCTP